jgi:hypothetical protein
VSSVAVRGARPATGPGFPTIRFCGRAPTCRRLGKEAVGLLQPVEDTGLGDRFDPRGHPSRHHRPILRYRRPTPRAIQRGPDDRLRDGSQLVGQARMRDPYRSNDSFGNRSLFPGGPTSEAVREWMKAKPRVSSHPVMRTCHRHRLNRCRSFFDDPCLRDQGVRKSHPDAAAGRASSGPASPRSCSESSTAGAHHAVRPTSRRPADPSRDN